MTIDTVKNAKITTESVVNFVFFEMLTTEKSAEGIAMPIHWLFFYEVKEYILWWNCGSQFLFLGNRLTSSHEG